MFRVNSEPHSTKLRQVFWVYTIGLNNRKKSLFALDE